MFAAVIAAAYAALLAGAAGPGPLRATSANNEQPWAFVEGGAGSASTFFLDSSLLPFEAAATGPQGGRAPAQLQAGEPAPAQPQAAVATATATASPSPTPQPARRDLCEQSASSALYCIYTVRAGDTLSAIAQEFGLRGSGDVSAAEMLALSNKPEVVDSNSIRPGQKLRIPVVNGVIHTVFAAETLSEVAAAYGVSEASIRALGINGIADPSLLRVGQEIIVPSPEKVPSAAAASGQATPTATATLTATPTSTPMPTSTPTPTPEAATASGDDEDKAEATVTPAPTRTATSRPATRTPTPARTPTTASGAAVSSAGFIWPATGPISSYFGPRHPLGIDIDFYADPNQPVKAAAAGTVTFAGGDPCCSYGYYVIVDHGNGFTTLYAHFSKILVSAGQKVAQGEVLGLGGRTGLATGNHLHFEIRKDGVVVNPLNYLP